MSDRERRGRVLFFVVATVLILDVLSPLYSRLSQGFADVAWFGEVIRPLIYVALIARLWRGETLLVQLIGWTCLAAGLQSTWAGFMILRTIPNKIRVFIAAIPMKENNSQNAWKSHPSVLSLCHYFKQPKKNGL